MAEKVVITDPYKFDPNLKDKSDEQLQNEIDFRQLVLDERKREQARKEVEALVDEVNAAHDAMVKSANFLNEQGVLAEAVIAAYMTSGGSFAPHLRHRHVDADKLLAIRSAAQAETDGKPKKTRGPRKAKE